MDESSAFQIELNYLDSRHGSVQVNYSVCSMPSYLGTCNKKESCFTFTCIDVRIIYQKVAKIVDV